MEIDYVLVLASDKKITLKVGVAQVTWPFSKFWHPL